MHLEVAKTGLIPMKTNTCFKKFHCIYIFAIVWENADVTSLLPFIHHLPVTTAKKLEGRILVVLIFVWSINLLPKQYNCIEWSKPCVFVQSSRRLDKQSITLIGEVFVSRNRSRVKSFCSILIFINKHSLSYKLKRIWKLIFMHLFWLECWVRDF